jgi:glycolate oxidase FAD binding subunit
MTEANPFAEIVDRAHVRRGAEDDAVDGVVPRWVARPASVEELADALRAASAHEHACMAVGFRQHVTIGAPPRRLDTLFLTTRLSRILDHQAADMTVRVEAGCALAALERVLARAGQWLPLDPPAPATTTVGGMLAANLSGPLRASQGTSRDLLLGIRTIEPDGTVVSGGGRVVKNVAGYDLPKLHVGALGTLGVIAEATFKVRPRPMEEAALVIDCTSPEDAGEVALVARDVCDPLWLEIVGRSAREGTRFEVLIGAGGLAEEVSDALERCRNAVRGAGRSARMVEDAAQLRARVAAFPLSPAAAVLRAATVPTEVPGLLAAMLEAGARQGEDLRLQAHAASGIVRARIASAAAAAPLIRELRGRLADRGGSLVVERASPDVKRRIDPEPGVWHPPGPALGLMQGVKRAFDPDGRLAPGRFAGGI